MREDQPTSRMSRKRQTSYAVQVGELKYLLPLRSRRYVTSDGYLQYEALLRICVYLMQKMSRGQFQRFARLAILFQVSVDERSEGPQGEVVSTGPETVGLEKDQA